MVINDPCFTHFTSSIEKYDLPERFTFPFYYQPHPLCILASEQLQQYIEVQSQWQHNFGLSDDPDNIIGKMFGVLLVKNAQAELGFISAFSGKLAKKSQINGFVPPVFDLLTEDSFFLCEQVAINQLNDTIKELENAPELSALQQQLSTLEAEHDQQLLALRGELVANRKVRKLQRQALQKNLQKHLDKNITDQGVEELARQSVFDKWRLKDLTHQWQQSIEPLQLQVAEFIERIAELKLQRKNSSADLQHRIFSQYQFLNTELMPKTLVDIFSETALKTPPAGAGECAAPKLLQYAFQQQLTPLAMAE